MSGLHDVEKQLESLTRGEKAQLLQRVARDIGDSSPGIESTPGVCGGEPCIVPHTHPRLGARRIAPAGCLGSRTVAQLSDAAGRGSGERVVLRPRPPPEIDQQIRDNEEA